MKGEYIGSAMGIYITTKEAIFICKKCGKAYDNPDDKMNCSCENNDNINTA
jgi:hypothetical protein